MHVGDRSVNYNVLDYLGVAAQMTPSNFVLVYGAFEAAKPDTTQVMMIRTGCQINLTLFLKRWPPCR